MSKKTKKTIAYGGLALWVESTIGFRTKLKINTKQKNILLKN